MTKELVQDMYLLSLGTESTPVQLVVWLEQEEHQQQYPNEQETHQNQPYLVAQQLVLN